MEICSEYHVHLHLTWFSPRQHFLIPGYVMMHYFFSPNWNSSHFFLPSPLLYFHQIWSSMTFTLVVYILSKRISWSWRRSCMDGICIQIGFALLFSVTYGLDHMFPLFKNKIKVSLFGLQMCPEWFLTRSKTFSFFSIMEQMIRSYIYPTPIYVWHGV